MKRFSYFFKSKRPLHLIRFAPLALGLLLGLSVNAQTPNYVNASSSQVAYPTTTTGLHLDRAETKYLSNFSFPGSGTLSGSTIELAGWSTDNDGAFSYGLASAVPPYAYTGYGTQDIPNAREVQVGYLQFGPSRYVIASYYDVAASLYAYDLYSFVYTPFPTGITVTKLYTYHFPNPDFTYVAYTPTSDYFPAFPGASPGSYPPPPVQSSMDYNRISMDINANATKVAIVLTDNASGYMYVGVGQTASGDTVSFSPYLPGPAVYPALTLGGSPETPDPVLDYGTYAADYVSGGGGTYFDLYDDPTSGPTGSSVYVRYYPGSNQYYYSYYPIDDFKFVTVVDGATNHVTSRTGSTIVQYSPLIGIKATGLVTGPGSANGYFNQYWPDITISEDEVRLLFYANNPVPGFDALGNEYGAEDLYVSYGTEPLSDLYNYTGQTVYGSPASGYRYAGPTHLDMPFINSFDLKPLRGTPTTTMASSESRCNSLPLASGEEIRAKIDAPEGASEDWAITFAYTPQAAYTAEYRTIPGGTPYESYTVNDIAEVGKNNIYVRRGELKAQDILNNGSIADATPTLSVANNTLANTAPTLVYRKSGGTDILNVAWVSEDAGVGTPWSYIAADMNITGTTPVYRHALDYLRIPATATLGNDCGDHPLVALSRHEDGLNALYTAFSQDDPSIPLYTIQHQNHPWVSTGSWRKTPEEGISVLQVGPNPFSNTLHIRSSESLSISLRDVLGRELLQGEGMADELNVCLDNHVPSLAAGIYLLNVQPSTGQAQVFKLEKR